MSFNFVSKLTGDYYSEVLPYVDYFVLETNNQAGHWNYKPDFNFNLNSIVSHCSYYNASLLSDIP